MPIIRIAAIVVTHRGGDLLAECLESLRAQTRPVDELLVVVSNTVLTVSAPSLQLGANVGYARAANAGVRATQGEVLLLNDDTRLAPDCVARLVDTWTEPGVYQPRIRLADGSGRLDNVGLGFLPDGSVWARGRNGPDRVISDVPGGFSGAAVLIARQWWEALGGFDERFGSFGEDVDLALRLHRRGAPFFVVPDAVVEHHLGASWGRVSVEKIRRIEHNRVRAAIRSMPASTLAALPLTTAARYALFAGLGVVGRGPGHDVPAGARLAALEGLLRGIADAPRWWAERRRDAPNWTRGELDMLRLLWAGRAWWEDVVR